MGKGKSSSKRPKKPKESSREFKTSATTTQRDPAREINQCIIESSLFVSDEEYNEPTTLQAIGIDDSQLEESIQTRGHIANAGDRSQQSTPSLGDSRQRQNQTPFVNAPLPSTDSGSELILTGRVRDQRNTSIDRFPISHSELDSINDGILPNPEELKSWGRTLRHNTILKHAERRPDSQTNWEPGLKEHFTHPFRTLPNSSPAHYSPEQLPRPSSQYPVNISRAMSRRNHLESDEALKLDVNDVDIQSLLSNVCGNGSNYNSMPNLEGFENWGEWDEALKNAAIAEHVAVILKGLAKPMPPPDPSTSTIWNKYVRQLAFWQRCNDNLLAGIRQHCSANLAKKVKGESEAYKAYKVLQKITQQKGEKMLGEVITGLVTDTLQQHSNIQDFTQAFKERLHKLERMQLKWKMPEELCQCWFLSNLGDTFSIFRSQIYQQYRVGGVGNGADITLDTIMELAQYEYQRLQTEKKISYHSGNTSTGAFTHIAHKSNKHRRDTTGASNSPWKRTKLDKPDDYKGPFQKVCSIHGWLSGPSNHNDSECDMQNKY